MFQSVRQNSQVYIFYKGQNPRLETGYVVNQPVVKPKYTVPQTFNQQQEMTVDLVIKVKDSTINLNGLPAQADIADSWSNGENIVVSVSKDAMNAEILSAKQKSVDIVNSVDTHRKFIAECDTMLGELNPQYAEDKERKERFNRLESQVSGLAEAVSRLTGLMLKDKDNEQNLGNN